MSWRGSRGEHRNWQPPGWAATRRRIFTRDAGRCHICGQPGANEVDHIVPVTEGGTHHDSNLAAIHARPCHEHKTQAEAAAARRKTSARRPDEPHPGTRR